MPSKKELTREDILNQLATLNDVFAAAAIGDFSKNVKVPTAENELTELMVGVQLMVEVVREKLADLENANNELESRVAQRTAQLEAAQGEMLDYINRMSTLNAKVDLKGKFLVLNETAVKASGYTREFVMRTNFVTGPWWSFNKDVQKRVKEAWKTALSGQPISYDEQIQLGGKILWLKFSLQPVKQNGKVAYVVAEGADITAQKELEESLLRSEGRLRSIVENAPNFIEILDDKFVVVDVNRVVPGGSKDAVVGRKSTVYLDPEQAKISEARFQEVMKTGQPQTYESNAVDHQGVMRYYRTSIGPVKEGDKIVGLVLIATDVTEDKERNLELERFNKLMIGRELKMVELKNQLDATRKKEEG